MTVTYNITSFSAILEIKYSAGRWIRTTNLLNCNQVLYHCQLSSQFQFYDSYDLVLWIGNSLLLVEVGRIELPSTNNFNIIKYYSLVIDLRV